MPRRIVNRAEQVLKQLEQAARRNNIDSADQPRAALAEIDKTPGMQLSFFQLDDPVLEQVRDEIMGIDINNLTPIEALTKLNDIRNIITGKF